MIPTLTVRSKLKIQATASYRLEAGKKVMAHSLEAYLFVPKSLGVNADTYPKYLFYRDLQTYSELMPGHWSLSHLVVPETGLLTRLRHCIDTSAGEGEQSALRKFETHNRTFCRVLRDSIQAHVGYILRKGDTDVAAHGIEQYLGVVRQVLDGFRALKDDVCLGGKGEEYESIILLGDEYISLLIEESSCRLVDAWQGFKSERAEHLVPKLRKLARGELEYRRQREYPSVPSTKHHNERLVYRRSALRTYTESVFYLNTWHQAEGRLARELLLSLAAGSAMIFATAVAFLAHVRYENWTTSFFLILVISYMFKDRIKALTQDYLKSKSSRFFYDFKTKIYGQMTRRPLGTQRESFSFVASDKIDPEVMRVRDRDRVDAIDNDYCGEHVILYRRRTRLQVRGFGDAFEGCRIEGLNEIIHFDLTRFARKMENAKSLVYIPGEKGLSKVNGRYVYHLNIVLKYQTDEGAVYQRFRIVMGQSGIRRIDTIQPA